MNITNIMIFCQLGDVPLLNHESCEAKVLQASRQWWMVSTCTVAVSCLDAYVDSLSAKTVFSKFAMEKRKMAKFGSPIFLYACISSAATRHRDRAQ